MVNSKKTNSLQDFQQKLTDKTANGKKTNNLNDLNQKNVPDKAIKSKKTNTLRAYITTRIRTEKTRHSYYSSLLSFLRAIYTNEEYSAVGFKLDRVKKIEHGIENYLSEERVFYDDINTYVRWLNANTYAPKSSHCYVSMVKKFFSRQGYKLTEEQWEDISNLLPPNKTRTIDKILTKKQLRSVLSHLGVYMRPLTLFLVSTGARIGETLQLKVGDLELDHDPPQVTIRPQYTKKEVGGRVMWFSYEARDSIKEWLKVKDLRTKKSGQPFTKELLFGISARLVSHNWIRALEKAGFSETDPSTKVKVHVYHIHTLRKFFSTQMSDVGKVQEAIIHAWMGHAAYLATAYKRHSAVKLAEMYKNVMPAVSVYSEEKELENTQMIIDKKHLPLYLETGWEFKAYYEGSSETPEGKIIIIGKRGQRKPIIEDDVSIPNENSQPTVSNHDNEKPQHSEVIETKKKSYPKRLEIPEGFEHPCWEDDKRPFITESICSNCDKKADILLKCETKTRDYYLTKQKEGKP